MTDQRVAVVTPCHRAQDYLPGAARSVLAQTHSELEWWIVADDGEDYESLLAAAGLGDSRWRFASTGRVGAGAAVARNVALECLETPYAAFLDADDRMKPDKLAVATRALAEHAIVSCALDVRDADGRLLRRVGDGENRRLDGAGYKFVNLSMDAMIVWDRRRGDARADAALGNMIDLEFLMRLWEQAEGTMHLGTPLHDYVKVPVSLSNGSGVTARMVAAKTELLRRLDAGSYSFVDPSTTDGLAAFLRISLAAETAYPQALLERPGLLFEDHLEPMLRAGTTERRS